MKTIRTEAFIEFIKGKQLAYQITGETLDSYRLASLFGPIENGLYFFVGNSFDQDLNKSLVIIDPRKTRVKQSGNNAFLEIYTDPQLLFYEFVQSVYGRKSTGKIAPTAMVDPEATIGRNVQIDDYCIIGKCEIGDDVIVGSHTHIHEHTIIGKHTIIEPMSVLGAQGLAWIWNADATERIILPQLGGVKIGQSCLLAANTIIVRGSLSEYTVVGDRTFIAPGCRIGHGTIIGNDVHFANNIATGGNSIIGDNSFIGSGAVIGPKVKLDHSTIVGGGAVVVKSTSSPGLILAGVPAKEKPGRDHPHGMPKPKKMDKRDRK